MKICFLTNTPFVVGGVERVLSVIANELIKFYDVTIACTLDFKDDYNLYNLKKNVKVEVIPNLINNKMKYPLQGVARKINGRHQIKNISLLTEAYFPSKERRKIISYFETHNFDLIIGVQDQYSLLLSILSCKINTRCIGWFHSSYRAYFETPYKYSWNRVILFKNYIKNLEKCITLTENDEKKCNETFGEKFNCINNPLTCPVNKNSDLSANNVLLVGRLIYDTKGLDYFIEIAKCVVELKKDVKFIIVGDGPDKILLEKEIKDNKLENNLICVGSTNNVSQYYSMAKIVINTSRWEGFGLVITESMAHGVPVIAFNNEGPSEIITDGLNGYLIERYNCKDFAERIFMLLGNQDLCFRMGKNALKRSKDFMMETIIAQWRKYIER